MVRPRFSGQSRTRRQRHEHFPLMTVYRTHGPDGPRYRTSHRKIKSSVGSTTTDATAWADKQNPTVTLDNDGRFVVKTSGMKNHVMEVVE
jgi:hypothetical protein